MARGFIDRCGNCAFSRPATDDENKIECVCGGTTSAPMSQNHSPCICYRPSIREMRRRDPGFGSRSKGRPKKAEEPPVVVWTDEMVSRLRALFANNLYTVSDIARMMGLFKKDVVTKINELGLSRKPHANASKAKTLFRDGNNLPIPQQKYPRIRCCKGQCCKYKEQCAHYAHWLEMGKPQFDTINSVGSCINSPYSSGAVQGETLHSYREFLALDMETRTPEPITYTEIP